MSAPNIVRATGLSLQVCVPKEFTDEQVREVAERLNPCGTDHGWQIRRAGDPLLIDHAERVQCAGDANNVHIVLDA